MQEKRRGRRPHLQSAGAARLGITHCGHYGWRAQSTGDRASSIRIGAPSASVWRLSVCPMARPAALRYQHHIRSRADSCPPRESASLGPSVHGGAPFLLRWRGPGRRVGPPAPPHRRNRVIARPPSPVGRGASGFLRRHGVFRPTRSTRPTGWVERERSRTPRARRRRVVRAPARAGDRSAPAPPSTVAPSSDSSQCGSPYYTARCRIPAARASSWIRFAV